MPKLATLIVRPKYYHRKQVKNILRNPIPNQSVLNDEIEKKSIKKITQKIT